MKGLLTSFLVVLAVLVLAEGLSFTLGPGKEECFYENVNQGTTVSIVFQVNTGGRNDIDLNVRNPSILKLLDRDIFIFKKLYFALNRIVWCLNYSEIIRNIKIIF